EVVSIATEGDRTWWQRLGSFELLSGREVTFDVYCVAEPCYYRSTRTLTLQAADGVVFLGDSRPANAEANQEALRELREDLSGMGLSIETVPLVFQWCMRDAPDAV